jgi:hypothetical protein
MTPRLTAGFWVAAYLARLRLADIPAYVTARGDATAGAVLVRLSTLNGRATAFQRSFDPTGGDRVWMVLTEGEEAAVDAPCVGLATAGRAVAGPTPSAASASAAASAAAGGGAVAVAAGAAGTDCY